MATVAGANAAASRSTGSMYTLPGAAGACWDRAITCCNLPPCRLLPLQPVRSRSGVGVMQAALAMALSTPPRCCGRGGDVQDSIRAI